MLSFSAKSPFQFKIPESEFQIPNRALALEFEIWNLKYFEFPVECNLSDKIAYGKKIRNVINIEKQKYVL